MTALRITEIYKSIQGESRFAGYPCTFIRTTGCPLRCRWCDTAYAFEGGEMMSFSDIMARVRGLECNLVEITGGEPLAQIQTPGLVSALLEDGLTVLIETGGSESIANLPQGAHIIMDIKCPGSGMAAHNLWENFESLKASDEVKFVLSNRSDYDWALEVVAQHDLDRRFQILFSCAFGLLKPLELAEWLKDCGRPIRLQLQQHKYIWSPKAKGV